jgi:TusA-related sulfurtransferase
MTVRVSLSMTQDQPLKTVDGTRRDCKGVIAGLEESMNQLAPGGVVEAVVSDVLNRQDVLSWAKRKGHRVLGEVRRGSVIQITIAKRGECGTQTQN